MRTSDRELRRLALGALLASFPGTEAPDWLRRTAADGLGGVCLYGSNRGADMAAVAAELHAVRPELVVALDEEGGDVTRIEAATGSSVPGNAALGAVDDERLTHAVGQALGRVLRAAGVDLDLAPCADINSDPDNPVIGVRSFGADAGLVAVHVAAFVAGLQETGVAACAKHFPGHGAVAVDSHLELPTLDAPAALLRERELVPFRSAIAEGVRAVMPGHLLVPAFDPGGPATVSHRIVTALLRRELGFAGLVVTDALDMGGAGGPDAIPASAVAALAAGADLCCLGPDNDEALVEACVSAVLAAVVADELPLARLQDAATRVASFRLGTAEHATEHATERATHRIARRRDISHKPSPEPPHERGAGLSPDEPPGRNGIDEAQSALAAIGAETARRALRVDGDLPASLTGAQVIELDRPANVAAGAVPWGLAPALASLDPTSSSVRIAAGDDRAVAAAAATAAGRPMVVVVRDAHRHPAQAAALAELVAARPDAVVVDMGWPAPTTDRPAARAWITTYGASRASAAAAARRLAAAPSPTAGRTPRG